MEERQENFIEYVDKDGNLIMFNPNNCDFYIDWKEEAVSGMPKSKVLQKEWLALFSRLISNRYKATNFDRAWDILTPNIEKKHELLEEILMKEPRAEIKILALTAYPFASDLLNLEPKPLKYFGIKEGEKVKIKVKEKPIQKPVARGEVEKVEREKAIGIKPREEQKRKVEIHLPELEIHWPKFNLKQMAYAAIGSTVGCVVGFMPAFFYLYKTLHRIDNNIYKNKVKCLEIFVSNLKNKTIDSPTFCELTGRLKGIERDTIIPLSEILGYNKNDDFGRLLESNSILVVTDRVVPPFGNDPYIITSGMKSMRRRGGDETHRHNALDLVPNMEIDSKKGITWRDIVNHPIYAQTYGTVEYASKFGKYGLLIEVVIDKGPYKGVHIRYGHLSYIPKEIEKGTKVEPGTLIGYMGNTGNCEITKDGEKAYHLHWEAFYLEDNCTKRHINPLLLLRKTKLNCEKTVGLIKQTQNYIRSNTPLSK